jgi:hypothetical protein
LTYLDAIGLDVQAALVQRDAALVHGDAGFLVGLDVPGIEHERLVTIAAEREQGTGRTQQQRCRDQEPM